MQIIYACNMFMDGRAALMMSRNFVTFVVIVMKSFGQKCNFGKQCYCRKIPILMVIFTVMKRVLCKF